MCWIINYLNHRNATRRLIRRNLEQKKTERSNAQARLAEARFNLDRQIDEIDLEQRR
jgi:dynactin complex subunit